MELQLRLGPLLEIGLNTLFEEVLLVPVMSVVVVPLVIVPLVVVLVTGLVVLGLVVPVPRLGLSRLIVLGRVAVRGFVVLGRLRVTGGGRRGFTALGVVVPVVACKSTRRPFSIGSMSP